MWAVMLVQDAGERIGTIDFWITIGVPTMAVLALMTLIRREFRSDFPAIGEFTVLKTKVDEIQEELKKIPQLIEKTDFRSRSDRNHEFGRLRDSIDKAGLENRELIKEVRMIITSMNDEQGKLRERFSVFEEHIRGRLDIMERRISALERKRVS